MVNVPENVEPNLFALMLGESKKSSALIGVADGTILEIYKCPTDWEFILKMDALLEAAVRKVVKVALAGGELIDADKLEAFVDALPMRGRTSLIELLKATQCGDSEVALIDCVRRLRNGFAHDIVQINSTLIEVIKRRNDKSVLMKGLSYIENYNEADLINSYEKEGRCLLAIWNRSWGVDFHDRGLSKCNK
jgi:hypothetical protein